MVEGSSLIPLHLIYLSLDYTCLIVIERETQQSLLGNVDLILEI